MIKIAFLDRFYVQSEPDSTLLYYHLFAGFLLVKSLRLYDCTIVLYKRTNERTNAHQYKYAKITREIITNHYVLSVLSYYRRIRRRQKTANIEIYDCTMPVQPRTIKEFRLWI
jgi:hypothetical protein